MKQLRIFSPSPLKMLDIGARAGINHRWLNLIPKFPVQIIGFEPDETECSVLNAKGDTFVKYLPFAVGKTVETRNFHLLKAAGSSSLFRPNYSFINRCVPAPNYAVEREVMVKTNTLDSILKQEGISDIDYIKIDTEGCERDILMGATETLKEVFAIEVEVWFNPVFTEAPLFREIDFMLSERGFVLYDLAKSNYFKRKIGRRLGGPKGQLVAGDAIYFRDIPTQASESLFIKKDKLVRAVVVAMQYRYFDFALEIIEHARHLGKLTDADFKVLASVIEKEGRFGTIDFRGKHTAEKWVKRIGRFLTKFEWDYLGNW